MQVKELVGDLCKVRFSKINAGLQVLQGPMTVKLNNLSAAECNVIRAFFQGALDRFYLLAQVCPTQHLHLLAGAKMQPSSALQQRRVWFNPSADGQWRT